MRRVGLRLLAVLFLTLWMFPPSFACAEEPKLFESPADMAGPTITNALEIADYARRAGWPEELVATATAIAMAESFGDPSARGDVRKGRESAKWGPSVGWWQVRALDAERGTGGFRDEDLLEDRLTNAQAALAAYRERGNFEPWSVYTSGKYLDYLPDAEVAVEVLRMFKPSPKVETRWDD